MEMSVVVFLVYTGRCGKIRFIFFFKSRKIEENSGRFYHFQNIPKTFQNFSEIVGMFQFFFEKIQKFREVSEILRKVFRMFQKV